MSDYWNNIVDTSALVTVLVTRLTIYNWWLDAPYRSFSYTHTHSLSLSLTDTYRDVNNLTTTLVRLINTILALMPMAITELSDQDTPLATFATDSLLLLIFNYTGSMLN